MRPLLLAMALLLGASACAPVKAWQRGNHTHPCMDSEHVARTALRGFHDHTNDVREGFTPCTAGAAGGGCGCN